MGVERREVIRRESGTRGKVNKLHYSNLSVWIEIIMIPWYVIPLLESVLFRRLSIHLLANIMFVLHGRCYCTRYFLFYFVLYSLPALKLEGMHGRTRNMCMIWEALDAKYGSFVQDIPSPFILVRYWKLWACVWRRWKVVVLDRFVELKSIWWAGSNQVMLCDAPVLRMRSSEPLHPLARMWVYVR